MHPKAVFFGRDSLRREVMVAVPAVEIISTIASDTRRRLAAIAKEGDHVSAPGTWKPSWLFAGSSN